MKHAISISIGKYGGFYVHNGYLKRICLGWIAFTYYPEDLDDIFWRLGNKEL